MQHIHLLGHMFVPDNKHIIVSHHNQNKKLFDLIISVSNLYYKSKF